MLYVKKHAAKYSILSYMLNHGNTSKVELAKQLNISMPRACLKNHSCHLHALEQVNEM